MCKIFSHKNYNFMLECIFIKILMNVLFNKFAMTLEYTWAKYVKLAMNTFPLMWNQDYNFMLGCIFMNLFFPCFWWPVMYFEYFDVSWMYFWFHHIFFSFLTPNCGGSVLCAKSSYYLLCSRVGEQQQSFLPRA